MKVVRLSMILLAMIVIVPVARAQSLDSLRALLVAYRCSVVDRLERIYEAGDHASPIDRFLAVGVPGHPHGYVQCVFFDNRAKLLCEASSGFFLTRPGEPRTFYLPKAAVAALGRLGFDTDDSEGNFKLEIDIGDAEPNYNVIADFILKALHEGYGARADMMLRFNAPFAPRATTKCVPVS